ncbi:hypothetical protein DERP_013651 [Dermatophagoides pteronyssinus]|uniref:Uncharacterized protein n=1 Tax=Dermatophagoides pteronyssinus TaxID=6956 RepID=A0ABQ8IQ50_DERPT|nr:hypothetical protein DERP_013651 [Dermatophagoides pteronyssinus]
MFYLIEPNILYWISKKNNQNITKLWASIECQSYFINGNQQQQQQNVSPRKTLSKIVMKRKSTICSM